MASCSSGGARLGAGSSASSTVSIRSWRARIQATKSLAAKSVASVCIREVLQQPGFQDLYLLLGILEGRLAELEQLRTALVAGECLFERQLAGFHPGDDGLQLGQGGLEAERDIGGSGLIGGRRRTGRGNRLAG